jgi:beta-xylosidase
MLGGVPRRPVHDGDFPDPFVLVAGGRYFAYGTQTGDLNVQLMESVDLRRWDHRGEALPELPQWAARGQTWAPAVLRRDGVYVLYYTARFEAAGRQAISVATASDPAGPFVDRSSGPLVFQAERGGSIDPSPFLDTDGTAYLLWKSDDNALHKPTVLWGRLLAPGGVGFAWWSSSRRLLTQTAAWQAPALEGPTMVKSGKTYFLFYGANDWNSSRSAIGYATCSGPLGPCVDRSTTGPWFATNPGGTAPVGPQGPTLFTDVTGNLRLGFAAWNGVVGYPAGARALWTARLSFANGKPVLN